MSTLEAWDILRRTFTYLWTSNMNDKKPIVVNEGDNCNICKKTINNIYTTKCDHEFCYDCLSKWLASKHTCPLCEKELVSPWVISQCTTYVYTPTIEPMTIYRFIFYFIGINIDFTIDFKKMMFLALFNEEKMTNLEALYYILIMRQNILDNDEIKRGLKLLKHFLGILSFFLCGILLFYQTDTKIGLIWSKIVFLIKILNYSFVYIDSDIIKTYYRRSSLLFTLLSFTNFYWLILPSFILSSNSDINILSIL
jgi:hypothetical protein